MYTHTLFVVLEALSRLSLKLGMCFTQPFIYFSKTIIDLQKLKDPMLPLGLWNISLSICGCRHILYC